MAATQVKAAAIALVLAATLAPACGSEEPTGPSASGLPR